MTIGNNIKGLHYNKGVTQELLGEVLGVPSQAVSKWENNSEFPENNMNIHIVPPEFCIQEINPFTNQVYDKNRVYIEVNDENEYQMFDKTEHGLFQTYLSRNSLGWQWRLMD